MTISLTALALIGVGIIVALGLALTAALHPLTPAPLRSLAWQLIVALMGAGLVLVIIWRMSRRVELGDTPPLTEGEDPLMSPWLAEAKAQVAQADAEAAARRLQSEQARRAYRLAVETARAEPDPWERRRQLVELVEGTR